MHCVPRPLPPNQWSRFCFLHRSDNRMAYKVLTLVTATATATANKYIHDACIHVPSCLPSPLLSPAATPPHRPWQRNKTTHILCTCPPSNHRPPFLLPTSLASSYTTPARPGTHPAGLRRGACRDNRCVPAYEIRDARLGGRRALRGAMGGYIVRALHATVAGLLRSEYHYYCCLSCVPVWCGLCCCLSPAHIPRHRRDRRIDCDERIGLCVRA